MSEKNPSMCPKGFNILAESRPPWEDDPYSLISWWDMEKFSAEHFYHIGSFVELAKMFAGSADKLGDAGFKERVGQSRTDTLELMLEKCKEIGLSQSVKHIKRLLETDPPPTGDEAIRFLKEIDGRIVDEMEDHLFMYISPARATRYQLPEPFGAKVNSHFPSAEFDMREAGNCYASGRDTACVFHLMRVLELGLVAFAKVFSVPSDHVNWQTIIEGIEKQIRNMGNDPNKASDWKDKQETYSQTASGFMIFKGAWRNYTAHARGKYIEEEADAIYRNVRSFMQRLAEIGIKE